MITGNIVKNFSLNEMMNKESNEKINLVITPQLVLFAEMLQVLRDYYKKRMDVTSWYRTKKFNAACGGSPNSAHLDGRAADILISPRDFLSLTQLWEDICLEYRCIGGVNYYSNRMHFTNYEDKFGSKSFVIRDKR